jgi:hypothetical protein
MTRMPAGTIGVNETGFASWQYRISTGGAGAGAAATATGRIIRPPRNE